MGTTMKQKDEQLRGNIDVAREQAETLRRGELIMVALCNRADHYIFALWFLSFCFFPRLISAVGDWMSTILPHMVWPLCEFRMHV